MEFVKDMICVNLDLFVIVLYMIDRFICVYSVEILVGFKIKIILCLKWMFLCDKIILYYYVSIYILFVYWII